MAITKRGKNSYLIEVDIGRDDRGKRKRIRETFRGNKKDAKLRESELKISDKQRNVNKSQKHYSWRLFKQVDYNPRI